MTPHFWGVIFVLQMYEWRKAYRDKEELMLERGFPEVSPHELRCAKIY